MLKEFRRKDYRVLKSTVRVVGNAATMSVEELKDELTIKHDELAVLAEEILMAGEVQKVKLQREYDKKQTSAKSLQQVIFDRVNDPHSDENIREIEENFRRRWEQHIHKIDFTNPLRAVQEVVSVFDGSGTALFLVPDCGRMLPGSYIQKVSDWLETNEKTVHFRNISLLFRPHEGASNDQVMKGLSLALKRGDGQGADDVIQAILELESGSVVFLNLVLELIKVDPGLFTWFIDEFWDPLVEEVARATKRIWVVGIVAMVSPIDGFPGGMCSFPGDPYKPGRFKVIELQDWVLEDLKSWVDLFSGFDTYADDFNMNDLYTSLEYVVRVGHKPLGMYYELMRVLHEHLAALTKGWKNGSQHSLKV